MRKLGRFVVGCIALLTAATAFGAPPVTTSDGKVVDKIFLTLLKVELTSESGAVTIFEASVPGQQVKSFDLLTLQTTDFFAGVGSVPDDTYQTATLTLGPAANFVDAAKLPVSHPLVVPPTTTITITPPLRVEEGENATIVFDLAPFIIASSSRPPFYTLSPSIRATPAGGRDDVEGIGLTIVSVDCNASRLTGRVDDHPAPPKVIHIDISNVAPHCLTDEKGAPITCADLHARLATEGTLDVQVEGVILPNGDIEANCVALQPGGEGENGQSGN